LAASGAFLAVRGASQLMIGHPDLAQEDLDSPLLKDDPESQFWRAAAHAGNGNLTPDLAKVLTTNIPKAQAYPHAQKWIMATATATAAIAAGDDAAAQQAFDMLDRDDATTPIESAQLDFLHGQYEEMVGKFEKAIGDYESASDSENREYRARSLLAETELLLKAHKITAKEAAERLDRMRFAWREENFEFALLKRYAELQREAGDYAESLRALRTLINYYSDNPDVPALTKMMSDEFSTLYLEGAVDTLPPVTAIGLYDEFRDLTPSGPKGDEMIRKLADRLAAVDLLDRAAELLKHQVEFRLQGLDKARVGAQLALLDLLNKDPKSALDALHSSTVDGVPADLALQRRHLEAHALSDLDREADAIAILQGDESTESTMLRAEIYWHAQDWANAATAFETLVPRPDRGVTLDEDSAKLVLSWATALVLGNDERGLAALRRNYGPGMEGTKDRDGFVLLTSALDRDVPDLPEIAGKIKEAEGFQTFMTAFRQRMQSSGLSGIN
jgi:tetratricopeptide (TPR) repeat protein